MAKELLGIATKGESEAVGLAAVRDALDRVIGLAPMTLGVSVGPKAWELVYEGIAAESRAEFRRRRGVPDEPQAAVTANTTEAEVIDAELVEPSLSTPSPPSRPHHHVGATPRRRLPTTLR